MIKIKEDVSKVFIICPAQVATGGPELLHQMAFKLNAMNIKAFMVYQPADIENPVHPYYEHYQIPFVRKIDNQQEHILIIPEVFANVICNQKFNQMQKVIWWLSVDNYIDFIEAILNRNKSKLSFKLKMLFNSHKIPTIKTIARRKDVSHFAQSAYATDFLENNGIKDNAYLSDYLGKAFFDKAESMESNDRKDLVLYNPKKGFEFTRKIVESAPHINFLPIQNLTPEQVSNLLSTAKIYIDFGNHPGKDRFPREAAVMGCRIITNKQGSANYYKDVPINEEFKFLDDENSIPAIISKIEECLKHFEKESSKFEHYRNRIKGEQAQFNLDLKNIFKPAS
jgi:hypothetical protein